jgi:HEAT repeat protein
MSNNLKAFSESAFRLKTISGRAAMVMLLLLILIFMTTQSHANGWEHGAIPFQALVKALELESPEMRMRAAQSLGVRGQPEAVEPLLNCLAMPEKNPRGRSALYTALGKLGDRRGIPALTVCLNKETREELRSDCVAALGMIGEESSLPNLLTALKKDSSFLVQSSVVDALGGFSDKASVQNLSALVTRTGGNRTLRQRAIRALGNTGSSSAVNPLLIALSDSRSTSDRFLVVRALTNLRSAETTEPLTALLHKTDDPQLRTQIVIALGAVHDGNTYPTLINMLADKVPAVRYFAVKSLHDQGHTEAASPISQMSLEISRQLARRSTRELLSEPVLVMADLSFQVLALQAIADLDAPQGLQAMLQAARPRPIPRESGTALKLAEGFYRQRRVALYGLGYTKSQEAASFLAGKGGTGDPDFRLRAVAVRSIGVLGFPGAVDAAIAGLNDQVAEVRWTATAVLGRLHDPKAVKALIRKLSDINSEVRRQAALSLGYLGDPLAAVELKRLAKADENQEVRTAAAYSLRLVTRQP